MRSLFQKDRLLDYIENFILYHDHGYKVVAKNHQFFGVNKAVVSIETHHDGKLGVFWHTQGSGKSFSMVMLCRKIFHKLNGNYTFLIITDCDDLDRQIYRNFLNTGVTTESQTSRPKNGQQLREFLSSNKRYIFTLIQKFSYPAGKPYPVSSERDDIIVIVDEAHRTQYRSLAENMRKALPNAQYMAFTGTPLLARDEKTKQWFGDYVSRYDFAQYIEDESTVKLFYDRRLPKVCVQNDDLEDELCEIFEDENLTDHQIERLQNKYASMVSVLTADDRLNTIAKDIARHRKRMNQPDENGLTIEDNFKDPEHPSPDA